MLTAYKLICTNFTMKHTRQRHKRENLTKSHIFTQIKNICLGQNYDFLVLFTQDFTPNTNLLSIVSEQDRYSVLQ